MTGHKSQDEEQEPAPSLLGPRVEFVVTMVLDTGVILSAIVCRVIVLRVLAWAQVQLLAPTTGASTVAETYTWAIRTIEFVSDVGMVGASIIFTLFDLGKRLRAVWREFRSPPSSTSRPVRRRKP